MWWRDGDGDGDRVRLCEGCYWKRARERRVGLGGGRDDRDG